MKRRTAIQGMIAASASVAIMPSCNFFQEPLKVYENIPLYRSQRAVINQLTKTHFQTSEYYMKNYLDFEFAPGRYIGCAAV